MRGRFGGPKNQRHQRRQLVSAPPDLNLPRRERPGNHAVVREQAAGEDEESGIAGRNDESVAGLGAE